MRWLVSFADHLCLVDRLVVVLDPADLGFAAGLALVDLKLVDLGRLVPAGSDLDLAIHFVNFAGLVGFALADLPVVLDLIDPVQFDLDPVGFDLVGPVLVVLDPTDLARMVIVQMEIVQMEIDPDPADLNLVDPSLVDFGLESFRHFRGGLVFDLARNRHWEFDQCPFPILSPFLTQSGLFRRHSRCEVEAL